MGWFWSEATPAIAAPVAPHPMPTSSDAVPPPSCPMHKPKAVEADIKASSLQACPYTPPDKTTRDSGPRSATISKLNPLNWMPTNLSNEAAPNQNYKLPLEREQSTIPKGDGSGNWEYPSPQQMYNALLRKGYNDTPVDGIEPMVAVHNFLNEGTWAEIMEWERRFGRGLMQGWRECARGEAGTKYSAAGEMDWTDKDLPAPQLARFTGRPGELSPRARMLQAAGWLFPSHFESEPPFDRHDWFVQRKQPDGSVKEVRYVIDYYSGPPESDGMPVFFLDVRPAVDTPAAAAARTMRWAREVWYQGTGAQLREQKTQSSNS
ncbi:cytochrome c and c1 heme-lyase [Microthyrium microscopicum]|uniref:Holocytochrome c-type synthase n=1 Tax=Microthyrium microscopicum TaxID=703497 RepID=A0A6A6U0X2_9PEZI|nr:cytochrome c and c1 heme-lyase [Microthyrium microscopicum]